MKTSQSTDARSKACGKGGACGVEAPEPHLYLLASPRRPICEWIHLSTYLDEPRNACLKPSSPRRSATSLLHGLHGLRGGGSLRGLHRLHHHGNATDWRSVDSTDFCRMPFPHSCCRKDLPSLTPERTSFDAFKPSSSLVRSALSFAYSAIKKSQVLWRLSILSSKTSR